MLLGLCNDGLEKTLRSLLDMILHDLCISVFCVPDCSMAQGGRDG